MIKIKFSRSIGIIPLQLRQYSSLITNQDGSLRLVLEPDIYKGGVEVAKSIVSKLYGPEKKVDIIESASD